MNSESIKVLQLRWIESCQKMYGALDKDVVQFDVKHKFDDVVLVHIEMVKTLTNISDQIEAELVQTAHTIKYMNEAISKLREDING